MNETEIVPLTGEADADRNAILLQWAAQEAAARRIALIEDFVDEPILSLAGPDGPRTVRLHALGFSTRIAARLLRDRMIEVSAALAANLKLMAVKRCGVLEAEFKQALADFEALSARARPGLDREQGGDE